jgi:transcriptional regulator with GAF, ATPase, and Fis domain
MSDPAATVHSESLPGITASARCQLVVIEGPDAGRAAPLSLPDGAVTIGTDPSCELCLTDDRVSRRHVTVKAAAGRFTLTDHDSTNGTLYEGSDVHEASVPLGATLKLGRSFVRIVPVARPLQVAPSRSRRCGELVGESLVMREAFAVLELAADSDVTVLLEGETGTGKELAARAVHDLSARRNKPFVAIDCGALPESLLESELFGHVKGAFTGAMLPRAGAFVRAHGGTLFLDELGGVSSAVQARLLRAVETRRVRPVGADDDRPADVRLLAASRHDLVAQVADGTFRPDLYYRLSVVRVTLPPLRSRREDLPLLAAEMLRRRGLEPGPIEGPGLDALIGHDWPGNVRELRNVLDRAIALSPRASSFADLRIEIDGLASAEEPWPTITPQLPWDESKSLVLHAFERRYLRALMDACQGNLSAASRQSGVDRKHLRSLLRRHGITAAAD